ncbi:MAG: ABC transporter substrate-binding protein [Bryobacteraceae bacterium]|nr:ABC transporter substrate-binding protein [Bryobacteraceae bacterium]
MIRLLLPFLVILSACHTERPPGPGGRFSVSLQADWYPQPEHGGFYTALAKGYYQAEGLEVTILPVGQYTSTYQVVSSGGADFGLGSSDQVLTAVSNGLPVRSVFAFMQHDPQAIMMHEGSPVRDFSQLEGRAIAAQSGATWLKFLVSQYHLKNVRELPATHSVASFLADPNYIQQIFITSEPFFVQQAGVAYRTMLINTAGYDPYRTVFGHQRFLDQHPEEARKFVRASVKGWQEYLRDPGPANAIIQQRNPAQKAAQMGFTLQALREGNFITGADTSGAAIGRMDPARWATMNQQLTRLGVIRHPVDAAKAFTTNFLP